MSDYTYMDALLDYIEKALTAVRADLQTALDSDADMETIDMGAFQAIEAQLKLSMRLARGRKGRLQNIVKGKE